MKAVNIILFAAAFILLAAFFIALPAHFSEAKGNYTNHYINTSISYDSSSIAGNGTAEINSTISFALNSTFYTYENVSLTNATINNTSNTTNTTGSYNSTANTTTNATNTSNVTNVTGAVNATNTTTYTVAVHYWNASSQNMCSFWFVNGSTNNTVICRESGSEQCCTNVAAQLGVSARYQNGNASVLNYNYALYNTGYKNNITAMMAYYNST